MKNLLYISIIFLITISCKKNGAGEFIEKSISGNLYYVDSSSGSYDKITLPNQTVYLSDSKSFDNYTLSTKSDSDGYFIFTHTPKDKELYIFSKAEIDNKLYEKIILSNYTKNSLILEPSISSKLSLLIQDNLGAPINGIKTFLYVNYNIAFADSLPPAGNGAIKSGTTNNDGLASFTSLSSRKYYIRINDSINGIKYKKLDSFNYIVNTHTDTTLVIN